MDSDYTKIYESLMTLIETFKVEHDKHSNGNASAGTRARKAIGEIKGLCTPYRKNSVEFDKARKAQK